ncbi:Uncharacterised protein [Bordetella pertussis]|nr:Uncharacterised protein [Bordetella pertussis]
MALPVVDSWLRDSVASAAIAPQGVFQLRPARPAWYAWAISRPPYRLTPSATPWRPVSWVTQGRSCPSLR